jgi:hypothetical protein
MEKAPKQLEAWMDIFFLCEILVGLKSSYLGNPRGFPKWVLKSSYLGNPRGFPKWVLLSPTRKSCGLDKFETTESRIMRVLCGVSTKDSLDSIKWVAVIESIFGNKESCRETVMARMSWIQWRNHPTRCGKRDSEISLETWCSSIIMRVCN